MRRGALAVAAVLLAAPVTPATARSRPLPPCVSYADPAGDSGAYGVTALGDPALDLTHVRFSSDGDAFAASLRVVKYAQRPVAAVGARYEVTFNLDGRVVTVYWKNGPLREHEEALLNEQGVIVDGAFVSGAVTGSVRGDTVTIAVRLTTLRGAVGTTVRGVRAYDVRATALASYDTHNERWDTAPGPESGVVVGATCR